MYGVRHTADDPQEVAIYPKFASEGSAHSLVAFHSNLTDTHWRNCKSFRPMGKIFQLLVQSDSFLP